MMPISGMAVSSILLSFLSCCEMSRVIFYTIRYFLLCLTLSIHPSLIPSPRHKVMSSNYFYHVLTEFTEFVLPLWLTAIIRCITDMSIFCLQLSNLLWKSSIFLKKSKHPSAIVHKKVCKILVSLMIYLCWFTTSGGNAFLSVLSWFIVCKCSRDPSVFLSLQSCITCRKQTLCVFNTCKYLL